MFTVTLGLNTIFGKENDELKNNYSRIPD